MRALLLVAAITLAGCASESTTKLTQIKGVQLQPGDRERCAAQAENNPCTVWTLDELRRLREQAQAQALEAYKAYEKGVNDGRSTITDDADLAKPGPYGS